MPAHRLAFRAVIGAFIGIVTLSVGASPAAAHNTLVSSSPADGAQLTSSPSQISLMFDLPAPLETASAQLIDANSVRTELTGLTHGPAGDTEIVLPLPAGLSGPMTVRWRLVSPDGHAITGRVSFTVTAAAATDATDVTVPSTTLVTGDISTPDTTTPASVAVPDTGPDEGAGTPGPVSWLLRYASYLAIGAVIGIALTDRLIWRGVGSQPTFRRITSNALALVAFLAFAQLAVLAGDIDGRSAWRSLSSLDAATTTDAGFALLIRIVLCAVAWALLSQMHIIHDEIRWTALSLTGIALMATWAWAGHAKSQRWPWLGVPVDIAHHVAAALWIGALAIVGTTALTALDTGELESVMRRMSTVAAGAVAVIVATGAIQTVRLVGSPSQLLDDAHGRYLVVKIVLVVAMLGLANRHRTRLATMFHADRDGGPQIGTLRRTIITELAIGLAIIGITAAMVVTPPSNAARATSGRDHEPERPRAGMKINVPVV
jgi:copper transport protein